MRQRLGLAAALLKKPELLILDEPTNGLDPAGIRDMRELITRLGSTGVTVLLSSHVLAEVQQVCSSVSIIGNGALLASGKVDELLGEDTAHTRVGVADPDQATLVLTAAGYAVARDGDDLLVQGHEHPEEITRALAGHDLYVRELSAVRPDLESFFLMLTGHRPVAGPLDAPPSPPAPEAATPEDRTENRAADEPDDQAEQPATNADGEDR
jgi:ABC-2 type transport system ATP-binding protein